MLSEHHDDSSETVGALTIPLESRVLGEFISGLLGQSRSIERQFLDRRFEIDFNWLLNLDQIISQRLASQNQAKLVSFSAKFYYANGKAVTLEDHRAFCAFHDLSNELATGVDLRWSYLIKFPLAKLPEKQEIRFQAFTDQEIETRKSPDKKESRSFLSSGNRDGLLSITINFTDVTWGEDVYGHMVNYIVAKTEAISKATILARKWRSSTLLPVSSLAGMAVAMWGFYSGANASFARIAQKFGNLDQLRLETLDEKIDLLISLTLARRDLDLSPFIGLGRGVIVISVLSGAYFLLTATKASFININDFSAQHLRRYGKNFDLIQYGVVLALIIGIAGGIFANRIYDFIKDWL